MIIIPSNKPYSWLQWPVKLLNCKEPDLHITAKFFGTAAINPVAVQSRCNSRLYLPRKKFRWAPMVFENEHVLELVGYPPSLEYIHDTFNILIDQFTLWRPHITVPHDYWNLVCQSAMTPQTEELSLGEMELFVRNDLFGIYYANENSF